VYQHVTCYIPTNIDLIVLNSDPMLPSPGTNKKRKTERKVVQFNLVFVPCYINISKFDEVHVVREKEKSIIHRRRLFSIWWASCVIYRFTILLPQYSTEFQDLELIIRLLFPNQAIQDFLLTKNS
jgi:hypothetical protein